MQIGGAGDRRITGAFFMIAAIAKLSGKTRARPRPLADFSDYQFAYRCADSFARAGPVRAANTRRGITAAGRIRRSQSNLRPSNHSRLRAPAVRVASCVGLDPGLRGRPRKMSPT